MTYTAVDISGKGKQDPNFHPVGLLYGIGDSLAQIQLNHVKDVNDDEYKYHFNADIYSLYLIEVDNPYMTSDDIEFASKLYSKNKGNEVLVISTIIQAKMFHRFYRKSNFVRQICSGDKLKPGHSNINKYFETEFAGTPHPEIRSEIEGHPQSIEEFAKALRDTVIMDSKQKSWNPFSSDPNKNLIESLYNTEDLPKFDEWLGRIPTIVPSKSISRYIKENISETNIIIEKTRGGNIVGEKTSLILYNLKGNIIRNTLKSGYIISDITVESDMRSSNNSVLKNISTGSLIVITGGAPAVNVESASWFGDNVMQRVTSNVTTGPIKDKIIEYNKKVDEYNLVVKSGTGEVRKRFYENIKSEDKIAENQYEDIDDIMWYRVCRDFGGVEFRVSHSDLRNEVNKGRMVWMKDVRSFFGVIWDVKELINFIPAISNYKFDNLKLIPGSKFIKHDDSHGTGWYHTVQEYTIGRAIVDTKAATKEFVTMVLTTPDKVKDYIYNNVAKSAAIISGLAGFGVIAYISAGSIVITLSTYLLSQIMHTLVLYKIPAGIAATTYIIKILDKYMARMKESVRESFSLMKDQIVSIILSNYNSLDSDEIENIRKSENRERASRRSVRS